jgi:hypothetical protein
MRREQVVYSYGRYNGRTLRERLPDVVAAVRSEDGVVAAAAAAFASTPWEPHGSSVDSAAWRSGA